MSEDVPIPFDNVHRGGVALYYRQRAAGGLGSFVIEAQDPGAIADAMLRKFLLDLLSVDTRYGRTLALAAGRVAAPSGRPSH